MQASTDSVAYGQTETPGFNNHSAHNSSTSYSINTDFNKGRNEASFLIEWS